MKLFLDYKTTRKFAILIKYIPDTVKEISASVAYTQDDTLMKICNKKKIHLDWWGLFNSDISSKIEIVKEAIKSPYIKFFPFAELFHSKLIWFHGYGVYIGSHNLTNNAMYNNVETGVFISENELSEEHKTEIKNYFSFLRTNSIPATIEDAELMEKYIQETKIEIEHKKAIKQNLDNLFEESFNHLFILKPGVQDWGNDKEKQDSKKKILFLQEWRETQKYLGIIHDKIKDIKEPSWVNSNADISIITDQILHAYYYSYLLKGKAEDVKSAELVNNEYEKNKYNPDEAIQKAIEWWEALSSPPSNENIHINEWNKSNKEILSNLRSRYLSQEELITVFNQNHAARNHARQMKNSDFGLPSDFKATIEERVNFYVYWILKQRTMDGLTIQDTMKYLLFEDTVNLEERVYNTIYNPKYHIEHFGRSIVGELLGWGRPEITHLRNNRVNKGLRALGFNVALFSD